MTAPGLVARLARLTADPGAIALIDHPGDRVISRGRLLAACHRTAQALYDAGVRPRHKAVVMTRDAAALTVVAYALCSLGAVPVLIEPRAEVGRCLRDIAPDVFIGDPLAHLARRLLGWGRPHVRTALVTGPAVPGVVGRRLVIAVPDGGPPPPLPTEPDADELAMIAFTSGSTGRPKGAEYRYATLAGQVDALTALLAPRAGDVLLAGFLPAVLLGPLMGVTTLAPAVNHLAPARTSPRHLIEPILRHRVTAILASPAVLGLIAHACARNGLTLPGVRTVLSFGAPLRTRLADALRAAVPDDAEILSVYGATECLPVAAINDHDLRATRLAPPAGQAGTCLGRPLPGLHARILDPDATGLGEIAAAGPTVSPAYHGRPSVNAVTKVSTEAGVLHRTGDLGRLDEHGRLWFLGRRAHLVTGAGFTLPTEDIEAAADTAPGVRRTALVGIGPTGAQRPLLCVELLPSTPRAAALAATRATLREHPDGHRVAGLLVHPGFPTDPRHNSKIDRPRLAAWAAKQPYGRPR
ncbi:AMP-binding protein [Streptomyces sp. NPDC087425]|uniref:AMP-binding protein n=1 Tax=Streptomyces sp. NPDC087425 TaxID=3365787 RepID=UPI00381FBE7E